MVIDLQTILNNIRNREYPHTAALRATLARYGINTPRRIMHFLAQMMAESSLDPTVTENLSYTAERLMQVWPRRFPTLASAQPYARNPERLANNVYANRMGNGTPASGDGWRFRGRGLIQLTGRANYRTFGNLIGVDLEGNPDLASTPEHSFMVAGAYWQRGNLNSFADADDVTALTREINGATRDAPRRKQLLATIRNIVEGTALRF